MSSILDALRKLEEAEAPAPSGPAWARERRGTLGLTVAGVALAFLAGAGLTFFLRAGRSATWATPVVSVASPPPAPPRPTPAAAPEPAPAAPALTVEPPPPPAAPAKELPPAAPAPPLPQAAVDAEPPRAEIAAAAPAPPPAPPPVARRPEPPAVALRAEPAPPPPPPAELDTPPAKADSPPAPIDVLPRLPPGAPHVQVSFLLYSRVAERRSVLLNVNGDNTEALHEGERAGDIEVTRILPDRVHVRWSGQLFSVRARD